MPLLLCPNDNTAMQEIDRNGVRIDVCPQCRGVWLDRGELEKLLEMVGRDRSDTSSRGDVAQRDSRDQPRYDDRDRQHDGDRTYDTRKRKKRFDLFDFFD